MLRPMFAGANPRSEVERLAGNTFGGIVRLDRGQPVGNRAHAMRFGVLSGPSGAPASLIVKRARQDRAYEPVAARYPDPAWLLFNEWAALDVLSRSAFAEGLTPRLYAGDRVAGMLLLEDLGQGINLDTLLLGHDADAAEAALLRLARALGRLHAGTRGQVEQWRRVRMGLAPCAEEWLWWPPWLRTGRRLAHARAALATPAMPAAPAESSAAALAARFGQALRGTASAVGVALAPAVEDDLCALATGLCAGQRFQALTHGDPCPGNDVIVGGVLRLVDFELAAFRPALLDGVYARMHFPTCWCVQRLPEPLVRRWEAAYRAELVRGFPTAADDTLFARALVEACAYWTLNLCQGEQVTRLLRLDRRWGPSSMRQRVLLRFAIFAQTTEEFAHLEALGAAVRELHARLGKRWRGAAEAALPVYPAFRS